ncbi:MAG: carboxypeptidase regulatory-like domain-containing protein [Nanoarchaeota archaeon]|nr:carboxypeptidase regulatory-like domain-containing protein [Nanoarchaeota archaeon]
MQSTKSLKLGILTLLLAALTIFSGCGGTAPPINHYGTAGGFVKDAVTRTGIEEAIVTISDKSNITDSNGAYLIENIPAGSQSIVVTALGYQDYNNSVTIEEGDNVIDDVLLEPGATHYEDTSDSDGIATFTLQDSRVVQTKVIDVVTGEPIPNIDSYLVTDGTDVAFLFIDPAGIYIPRIAPEEQSLRALARPPEERAIGTIKELWKTGQAQFSGYQPKYADQIENRLSSYMFKTFFEFCYSSTLGDLETSLWDFLVESGLDYGAGVAITAVIPGVNLALAVAGVVELGNTIAYELWVEHYKSRGYSLEQNFEVWRIKPFFLAVPGLVPFVFPIEEPSNLVIEENSGSISGKVLDALSLGIHMAQVEIVDLDLSTTTSSDGSYSFTSIPPGTYGIVAYKIGYNPSAQTNVRVFSGQETAALSIVLSSIVASNEYRIVLTWGENPRDLDSHLWIPNGEHCYYSNKTVSGANLDVDDTSSYGPETITITEVSSGTYTYAVKHYNGSGKITTSGATVKIYTDSGNIRTYEVDLNASCGDIGWYWTVFELNGNFGIITTINTFDSSSPRSINDEELLPEKM